MTHSRPSLLAGAAALAVALAWTGPLLAQAARPAATATAPKPAAAAAPKESRPSALGNLGSNTKDPIKIDADRLDVFDREGRAVFAGNVIAVQGDSTMRCSILTVLYEQQNRGGIAGGGGAPVAPTPRAPGAGDSTIKRIDCAGPVTVVSKTQTVTSDNATFDRVANRVLLTGNATLADGPNVTTGDRVVYDLNTGIANVENAQPGGRVKALFVPGSNPEVPGAAAKPATAPATPAAAAAGAPKPKPATAARPTGAATN